MNEWVCRRMQSTQDESHSQIFWNFAPGVARDAMGVLSLTDSVKVAASGIVGQACRAIADAVARGANGEVLP